MIRPILALALAGAAACASSGTVSSTRPVTQDIAVGGAGTITIAPSSGPHVNTLDYAPERVWKVLPAVFDSIGVPVSRLEVGTKTIGNDGFKIRQRLGKVALSRYFDCGATQIGANADSYDMFVTVVAQVQPSGTGSRLVTNVEASARPITFSQAYSRCTSRGALETRILDAITALLK